MPNLQAKGKKEAACLAEMDRNHRHRNGYTVFRFDFAPKYTKRDLTLGEAIRELNRLTGVKVGFWRCPMRGLAVRFKTAPQSSMLHDTGVESRLLTFSTVEDEVAAKRELILDVLLNGIDKFRGSHLVCYRSRPPE